MVKTEIANSYSLCAHFSPFCLSTSFLFPLRLPPKNMYKMQVPHCLNLKILLYSSSFPPHPICEKSMGRCICFNGSQLAKMKKSIPDMFLPWNLQGWSSWSKKCNYTWKVTISVKMWNLGQFRENLIFCQWMLNWSSNLKNSFAHVKHRAYIIMIICSTTQFLST